MIAVSVVVLPHFVRLTRASVMSESTRDYVTSAGSPAPVCRG
jgi:dipeptide transport system permease protein